MSSILSVGQSALNAAQAGLVTTGHNIANANTAGYTRQVVTQQAAVGQDTGFGYVGKGTQVSGIARVYDQFLSSAVLNAQISKGQSNTYSAQISQVNNMLADSTSGLTPVLQDFFSSMQGMAADPGSAAARQAALSSANSLAGRFQDMNTQLADMRQGINGAMQGSVSNINGYAQQIAKLNDNIEKAEANGNSPNDLLDQRDQAVAQLAQEIKVSVVKQGNTYNVMIGNGQPIVVGAKNYNLSLAPSDTDSSRMEVAYTSGNGQTVQLAENSLTGGNLGGIVAFRAQTLDTAQNALGRIAITVGSALNAQNRLGNDAYGQPGGDIFTVAQPVVTASSHNADKTATATATINDPSQLTGSDYQLKIDSSGPPATWTVLRLSDNKSYTGSPTSLDGVTFGLGSTGSFAAGDSFLVRPTIAGASAAGGISVAISDPAKFAAAGAVSVTAASANTGTGTISAGTVSGDPSGTLRNPVTISFTSPTTYTVNGTGPGLPAANQTYTAGSDISYNGWTVQISGNPAAGDNFAIGPTGADKTGDNRNALALAKLQNTSTTGGVSFQGAYSQLVSQVGNKAREVQTASAAADAQYDSALAAQQGVSGVNLDEEASNLLKYQQAYQAAGKVMKAADDMFQVLMSLGGN
ncbi:flagellar hook-associated protein FlgK [Noviherbaspirillum pedocola]|uniref:Flagellar hook-associated protein 1 n=1 Tax=Noviherbaspirillum pedocola TaxID=2801341 RepID=A0A934SXU8_9BURK|nr:flagellar hook-associated protein FlgK [Noviherbaspirillum pedocola]MBK4737031.1 flagellar hook-associated protein FlgK [Noviherbaspirillum pedocola]